MKAQNVLLFLSGAAATYLLLALGAGSQPRSKASSSLLGNPVPEAQAETTGTRLSAKVTMGSDGSKLFDPETLHDTTLDADCAFHKSSDGSIRCLPIVGPDSFNDASQYVYTDDQCNNQVVFLEPAPGGCTQHIPKFASRYVPIPYCGATEQELGIRVFQVGALVGTIGATYVRNPQGNCVQGGGGSSQGRIAYALSAEMPPSSFVEGSLGLDP